MEIIAAIIGAIVAAFFGWKVSQSDLGQKNSLLEAQLRDSNQRVDNMSRELSSIQQRNNQLVIFERKYLDVKRKLEQSVGVVHEYSQPVILVGPRAVGKTSLLTQWHAPWDHSGLSATVSHYISTVPIYDYKRINTEPHFADPDIKTDVYVHLKLQVHDFPGETGAQKNIVEQAKQETAQLRHNTGKSLGVVLICMFDASEVTSGISQSTNDYYNGELFLHLRDLVALREVGIERLILVFNKYDILKKKRQAQDDVTILKECLEKFKPVISPLRGACNPERVCEVFTILSRENMAHNNRGAPIVLGEASRNFVEAMAGIQAVQEVIKESATNYAANIFS